MDSAGDGGGQAMEASGRMLQRAWARVCFAYWFAGQVPIDIWELHHACASTPGCDNPLALAVALIAGRWVQRIPGSRPHARGDTFEPLLLDERDAALARFGADTADAQAFERLCTAPAREAPLPALDAAGRPAWLARVRGVLGATGARWTDAALRDALRFAVRGTPATVRDAQHALEITGDLVADGDGTWRLA